MKNEPSKSYQDKINNYMEAHWRFHNHLDHERHQNRIKYTASFCLPFKVLEIGSANGYSTSLIQEYRKDCTLFGVEPTSWGFNEACKNYPHMRFFKAFAEKLPFINCEFDTVMLPEVIEHCEEPLDVLKEVWRVTAKRLIVTHPVNEAGMKNDPTHLRFFDFNTMSSILQALFSTADIKRISHYGLDKSGSIVDDVFDNENKIFFGITVVDKLKECL